MAKEILARKQSEVAETSAKMTAAKTVVAFDYQGLTVEAFMKLRRNLRKNGCEVAVLKNNITRRAAIEAGFPKFAESLKGPKAICFGNEDEVSAAREIAAFAKENNKIVIGCGIVDGKECTVEEVNEIASLPSRETLLTQLAAGLYGTLTQLSIGLNMLCEKDAE